MYRVVIPNPTGERNFQAFQPTLAQARQLAQSQLKLMCLGPDTVAIIEEEHWSLVEHVTLITEPSQVP